MSDKASGGPASRTPSAAQRRQWTLDAGDPATVLGHARRALFVMAGVLAAIWIIQIANWADRYGLTLSYGIKPRDIGSLPYILTAPFLHFSWTHIEGNSGPLFIFGFLAAYRGIGKFAAVTAVVILTSGFAAWLFESPGSVGAGASGVVFGYFGYIIVRGLFDRHGIDVLVGAVMALCFAYQFGVLLPHQGIGWQAHVGGLIGGILSGWLLRERRATGATRAIRGSRTTPKAASTTARRAGLEAPGQGSQVTGVAGTGSDAAKTGQGGGKKFQVDPSNPRADLYQQLDDMGL